MPIRLAIALLLLALVGLVWAVVNSPIAERCTAIAGAYVIECH